MRIIYFGDGPWAQQAFDSIAELFKISMVVLRHNSSDEALRKKAQAHGIEVSAPGNVNAPEFLERLKVTGADLGVSMSYNQIFKENLMRIFAHGIINCHAGKLPEYRGRNVLNWALINGEKEIGVTCHYVDKGIDTGDIILQKTFPLTLQDDYATVLAKAHNLCADVLVASLKLIRDGKVVRTPQPAEGTYYPRRIAGDEFIDWSWSTERIYNFVRAITTPGPCAQSWVRRKHSYEQIYIARAARVEKAVSYHCIPGAVIAKSAGGNPLVKTGDTLIELQEYEIEGVGKKELKIGDRLGFNQHVWLLNNLKRE